jgi:hypothetical protein
LRRKHVVLVVAALILVGLMLSFDLEVIGLGQPNPGAIPP